MGSEKVTSTVDPIHILQVDDDLSLLQVSKHILLSINSNLVVESSTCVEEALSLLAAKNYDVIISDYEMSLKNG